MINKIELSLDIRAQDPVETQHYVNELIMGYLSSQLVDVKDSLEENRYAVAGYYILHRLAVLDSPEFNSFCDYLIRHHDEKEMAICLIHLSEERLAEKHQRLKLLGEPSVPTSLLCV